MTSFADKTSRMEVIADTAKETLSGMVPELSIVADDNICSSVTIRGTFDARSEWTNGIFHNGLYFIIFLMEPKGGRYYTGGNVTMELSSGSHKIGKLRKYTGTPEKCVEKIADFFRKNRRDA